MEDYKEKPNELGALLHNREVNHLGFVPLRRQHPPGENVRGASFRQSTAASKEAGRRPKKPPGTRRHRGILRKLLRSIISHSSDWIQEQFQIRALRKKMANAQSFTKWEKAARKLDTLTDAMLWVVEPDGHYDHRLVRDQLMTLRALRRENGTLEIAHVLRAGLHRNLGGIAHPALYQVAATGTKSMIRDYINEVVDILLYLSCNPFEEFPSVRKLVFLRETLHAFGRTALVLSGGATMAMYHLGVAKALSENALLPHIISGSSGGSIVAALVGVASDDELPRMFRPENLRLDPFGKPSDGGFKALKRRATRLWKRGVLFDVEVLQRCMRENIGDLTFLEAYWKTNRVLNITVTSTLDHDESS
ncbi:SDP1, partial [Symbiodinium sp. KB8]